MNYTVYNINPCPKPRMTQRNKFKISEPQARYNAFKDMIRLNRVTIPESGFHVIFVIPVPHSISKKKKLERINKPHTQRPDVDNYLKALFDAVHKEDSHIWDERASKIWGRTGKIIVITGIETDWISGFVKGVLEP